MLVDCLSSHIDHNSVSFKDEHGDTDVSKSLIGIEHFQISDNLLVIVNFLAQISKHHKHAQSCRKDAKDAEVRQEGVSLDPADWQSWNGHDHDVDVAFVAVAAIVLSSCVMANHAIDLLCDEVQITATSRQLHDPNRDVDAEFTPLAEYFASNLAIGMKSWVALCNDQVLHHRIDVEQAND